MRLMGLVKPLQESHQFNEVMDSIKKSNYPINVYGLSESGKSYFVDGIFENIGESLAVIAHSDMEAKNLYEDLSLYSTDVYYFPVKEVVFYNIDAISGDLRWARLKVIKEILQRSRKKIIVTSIDALTALYTPMNYYMKYSFYHRGMQ